MQRLQSCQANVTSSILITSRTRDNSYLVWSIGLCPQCKRYFCLQILREWSACAQQSSTRRRAGSWLYSCRKLDQASNVKHQRLPCMESKVMNSAAPQQLLFSLQQLQHCCVRESAKACVLFHRTQQQSSCPINDSLKQKPMRMSKVLVETNDRVHKVHESKGRTT